MVLKFTGGAQPLRRTLYGKQKIKNIENRSVSCIAAEDGARACVASSTAVKRGSLIGDNNGTPVYASVGGIFRGIATVEGSRYFVVMADPKETETTRYYQPEARSITDLTREDIIESAKKFSVIDSRSGQPLWRMLEGAGERCTRLVVDCTESDSECAVNYRLCIEKAKSIVGGSKVILKAIGALKCIFAAEYYRNSAFKALREFANDEKLFAFAQLDEKYPYTDVTIIDALYIKTLEKEQTSIDAGVLIISPETAIALFDAMVSGIPQLDRYISVCVSDVDKGGNLCVPKGTTLHDINSFVGGLQKGHIFVENSLLSGKKAYGAIGDNTRAIISVKLEKNHRLPCVSCGKCASACPVGLMPNEAIFAKNKEELKKYCIDCGACEFVCPSKIPLLSLIRDDETDKEA